MITFKEWLLFTAENNNKLSDMHHMVWQEKISAMYAGEASACEKLAKSLWAERYDAFKEENSQLREALQALYDAQNGSVRQEWEEAMRIAEEALKEVE